MSCKLKKNTWGPKSPLFVLYFKDCVMITNVWFWYFLSCTSWGYIGWGPRPGIWKVSFSLFFSFSPLSRSRGPFSSGAPGHCQPMPPSCYATDLHAEKTQYEARTHNNYNLYNLIWDQCIFLPNTHIWVVDEMRKLRFWVHCFQHISCNWRYSIC